MMKIFFSLAFCFLVVSAMAQNKNIGIGTASPQAQLHTTGSIRFDTLKGTSFRPIYVSDSGVLTTTLPSLGAANNTAMPIPDNSCTGVGSVITVNVAETSVPSADISVQLNLTHGFTYELTIFLVAPNGQILNLAQNVNGSGGNNFVNTVFTDYAPASIITGTGSFTGTFKPHGALTPSPFYGAGCLTATISSFAGFGNGNINPNGNWTLRVFDHVSGGEGTLQSWEISFVKKPNITTGYLLKSGTAGTLESSSIYEKNGKVGIGTTNPGDFLTVRKNGIGIVQEDAKGQVKMGFNLNGIGGVLQTFTNHPLRLYAGGNGSMTLTTNGDVVIDHPIAHAKLDVVGSKMGLRNFPDSWKNLWLTADQNKATINASGADSGLHFNVGVNTEGTYGDGQTLTTAMTLLPNGRVGIGTLAPFSQLSNTATNIIGSDAFGGNPASLSWSGSQQGYIGQLYNGYTGYGANGLAVKVNSNSATALDVSTGAQESPGIPLFTVKGSGNVGIGTNDPSQKLDVTGVVKATSFSGDGSTLSNVVTTAGTQTISGAKTFSADLVANGNVGIGVSNPTQKLEVAGAVKTTAVTTASTGTANMLAAAYGVVYAAATNTIVSSSNNCTLSHSPGTGIYTISFTSSNLSGVATGNLPIVISPYGNTPGFTSWTGGTGTITVYTFNAAGVAADRGFSFSVYKP